MVDALVDRLSDDSHPRLEDELRRTAHERQRRAR